MRRGSRGIVAAFLATSALGLPGVAQAATPAPKFISPDQNGVNLTTGLPWVSVEEGGIGSGPGRVSIERIWAEGAGWVDNWSGGMFKVTSGGVTKAYVQIDGISDTFTLSGSSWISEKADGATLTSDGSGYMYYTARDGTKIKFLNSTVDSSGTSCPGADPSTCQVPIEITQPSGLKFTMSWGYGVLCIDLPGEPCGNAYVYRRLESVGSSAGYSLGVSYASNTLDVGGTENPDWFKRTTVTFNNSASPPSPVPTVTYAYPNSSTTNVTDPGGRTWVFTVDGSGRLNGISRPGSSSNNISYAYGTGGTVTSATKDGVATSYALSGSTMTVTDALSGQTVVTFNSSRRPLSYRDPLDRTTSYSYDSNDRLKRTTQPESNYAELTYDSRGNVIEVKEVGKNATSTLTSTASYDGSCSNVNIAKCNKPNSTTDARGNTTTYEYNTTHGGLTKVTPPSPATGVQPETRYTYTSVAGAGGQSVYMLSDVAACPTGSASCTGSSEVRTTATYNSNLLPVSIVRGTTDTTLRATTAITYDARGNLYTVDGPLGGAADTTMYRHDAGDQLVGVISPDPDGSGTGNPLKHRAIRVTYRQDGQVEKQEVGTVPTQSLSDWNINFVPLHYVQMYYDTQSRRYMERLMSGTTRYTQTQFSYDALGRPDCTAVRMDRQLMTTANSLSACTPGANTDPADRITQLVYDDAGQVIQQKVGVGTPEAATERTLTYSANGQVASLKDGNSNTTTYSYDTFDRLNRTTYPDATYEQNVAYDANGNVTSYRNRAGQITGLTWDKLNRLTLKDSPSGELDVTYDHDNLGRLISASQTGTSLSFTYDALSRNLTQTGPRGTVTSEWDFGGRRTKITYPGTGLYVNYDYLVTGEVWKIRENGATSGVGVLATYGYNDAGRRTSVSYGNGTSRTYTYDPISSLSSMSLSGLTDSSKNLVIDTITYNPALQIRSQRRTAAYAWSGYSSVSRSHMSNNLNQVTQTTSSGTPDPAFTYDTRGNLASVDWTRNGSSSDDDRYCYDSENRLTGAGTPSSCTASATLAYDPFGRLKDLTASSVTTSFAYDGINLIAEYNGSTLLRRYVFGPGIDEPILQYEGGGTTDRRWLYADERGSVMAIADGSRNVLSTNSYDEYGLPGSSNDGRFQYTGQVWLPQLGIYYYKARFYSPTLGRFLQTDPIGYWDNANLYAYVGNDPINFVDPLGLCDDENTQTAVDRDGSGGGGNCRPPDTSDDVIVTGVRPPTVNISAALLVPSIGVPTILWGGVRTEHKYDTKNEVCARAMTTAEMKDLLSRFAVPGHGGRQLSDGIRMAWAGYLPGGLVSTQFFRGGLSVINTTTPLHAFQGSVRRDISAGGGRTTIATHGTGSAGLIRDSLNQGIGPKIFNDLDAQAKQYAKKHFKGC